MLFILIVSVLLGSRGQTTDFKNHKKRAQVFSFAGGVLVLESLPHLTTQT